MGHSLVGLAFAALAMPVGAKRKTKICLPVVFVALANLPDWPIPNWGHDRYDISHSIFVNLALILIVATCCLSIPRTRTVVSYGRVLLGAGAWLSHLLLDAFYGHGRGIATCWPIFAGRLNFAMPWFETLDLSQSMLSPHNLSVFGIELLAYFPLLVLAVVVAKFSKR
jgi:membrane-bound metal-dependent hydrolase YbcI (DUF457 family)